MAPAWCPRPARPFFRLFEGVSFIGLSILLRRIDGLVPLPDSLFRNEAALAGSVDENEHPSLGRLAEGTVEDVFASGPAIHFPLGVTLDLDDFGLVLKHAQAFPRSRLK